MDRLQLQQTELAFTNKEAIMGLADKQCVPCRGGVPPLPEGEQQTLLGELGGDWGFNAAGHLERRYDFEDFAQAIGFADRVGIIAELEGHHPDLHVGWGYCTVEIWTHKIGGLTESDFILAAKARRSFDARGA
jgi:4a-hydroxytetrahydrobiopterin dehydratase